MFCELTCKASDALSTGRVLKAIVQLCFDMGDWDSLNEHIVILTKRRSQLKTVSVPKSAYTITWCTSIFSDIHTHVHCSTYMYVYVAKLVDLEHE